MQSSKKQDYFSKSYTVITAPYSLTNIIMYFV